MGEEMVLLDVVAQVLLWLDVGVLSLSDEAFLETLELMNKKKLTSLLSQLD
jgi:hypothetical protein